MPDISDPSAHFQHFLITLYDRTAILFVYFLESIQKQNPAFEKYLDEDDQVEDDEDGFGGVLVRTGGVGQEKEEEGERDQELQVAQLLEEVDQKQEVVEVVEFLS